MEKHDFDARRALRAWILPLALAASCLGLRASAEPDITQEQIDWFFDQPENLSILSSDMSDAKKRSELSQLAVNQAKFGRDLDAKLLAMQAKLTNDAAAEEGVEEDPRGAEMGSGRKGFAAAGFQKKAKKKSGGARASKGGRGMKKKDLGPKSSKEAEAEAGEAGGGGAADTVGVQEKDAVALGGAGITRGNASKGPGANKATGGGSGGGGGDGGGGGGGSSSPAGTNKTTGGGGNTDTSNQILSVKCGATENVLTWKLVPNRNANSVLRSVNGAVSNWVCGGPDNIAPCTNLNVKTFTDRKITAGNTYKYRHKSAAGCSSNLVTCPAGTTENESCTTGAIGAPAAGGGTGGSGTGGSVDDPCTGNNPKCICVKENNKYRRYESHAQTATQAAFPGATSKPAGMSDAEATAKICAAYKLNKTLGPDSDCRSHGNDEIVFQDPAPPDSRYPTTSLDVVTSAGVFWRKPIAACALGEQ